MGSKPLYQVTGQNVTGGVGGGMTLVTGGQLVTNISPLQYNNPANKFNTISNLHKRGGGKNNQCVYPVYWSNSGGINKGNRGVGGSEVPRPAGEAGNHYETKTKTNTES